MMTTNSIDDDYLIGLLGQLVDIPSVFPNEEEVMVFLEGELTRIGLKPERIPVSEGRFNLLSRTGSGSPVFCLNAHSDTVPPSGKSIPRARIENGRMYGLGTCDDKGSVAAMVAAVKAINDSGRSLNGTLDLLISVDEEGQARGVHSAIDQGYRCDMAAVGEPSEVGVVPAHCGIVFADLVAYGEGTHGSSPHLGVNSIDQMHELVSGLRMAVTDYAPHPIVGPPSFNLGIIHAGDRPNRVPGRCDASVDIRLVPPMTVEGIVAKMENYFAGWSGRGEYTVTRKHGALDTRTDSTLTRAFLAAYERVCGTKAEFTSWRGWAEAEVFQSRLGIDAIVLGPGRVKEAHSEDEFVDLDHVRKAARIYASAALSILP